MAVTVAPRAPARLLLTLPTVLFADMLVLLKGVIETGPGPRSRVVVLVTTLKTGDINVADEASAKTVKLGVELVSGQMVVLIEVRCVTYTVASSVKVEVVNAARLNVPSSRLVVVMGSVMANVVPLLLT